MLLLLFIIVIESLLFPVLIICVLFDWSVSLSKKKVDTVGCTLWLALSKQIKILFFCDNNIILNNNIILSFLDLISKQARLADAVSAFLSFIKSRHDVKVSK